MFDEPPAKLIRHTFDNFNINPDIQAISRIRDTLTSLQESREHRVRNEETTLKKLSRTLNTMQSQHAELADSHSSAAHASEMARLDTTKFRTAKASSDAEMEAARLAQQAADLSARLQELELQGDEGPPEERGRRRDPVEDEVLLRLKVYRSLGIDLERDREGGEFTRAVVRSDRKGDVHVVNMDKKFSRFFYANYFWQTL